MTAMAEVWTAEQLKGTGEGPGPAEDPMLWGVPGHLTDEEVDVFFKFKEVVEERKGDFRKTVYCFGEEEGECWALCRWLRARKYVFDDVIKMVEEATETAKSSRDNGFFPNPMDALGCEAGLFFANYPQLYHGKAKNGSLVFFSKPGVLNVDGMECITTLDGIIKFHWHIMMHDFANRLRATKEKDPNHKKFDCFCVLDISGLTTSQLNRKSLAIIKEQAAIDSICFPETMSKMLIINAPAFFAASWRLIKSWLDPRTASKIEVISGRANSEKRLAELVDVAELPSDYGGTSKNSDKIIMDDFGGDYDKLELKMMYLRGYGSVVAEIKENEAVTVDVFTRSKSGATFLLKDNEKKETLVEGVESIDRGSKEEDPAEQRRTRISTEPIKGPMSLKIHADSKASRFSTHNYLVVLSFKNV